MTGIGLKVRIIGYLLFPNFAKFLQCVTAGFFGGGRIYGSKICTDFFQVFPGNELGGIADHMDDTQLDTGDRVYCLHRLGETGQAIHAGDENVFNATVLYFIQDTPSIVSNSQERYIPFGDAPLLADILAQPIPQALSKADPEYGDCPAFGGPISQAFPALDPGLFLQAPFPSFSTAPSSTISKSPPPVLFQYLPPPPPFSCHMPSTQERPCLSASRQTQRIED
jgi:hypothetical protein